MAIVQPYQNIKARETWGRRICLNNLLLKCLFIPSKWMIMWKKLMVTIKIRDLVAMTKWKCLCSFHTYRASKSTRSHPTRSHAISWKVINCPHQSSFHHKVVPQWHIISQCSFSPKGAQLIYKWLQEHVNLMLWIWRTWN